jgi:uncharacterized protein YdaT
MMTFTYDNYPSQFEELQPKVRVRAIDIANSIIRDGGRKTKAIPIAIEQAQQEHQKEMEQSGKQQFVVRHEDRWAVRTANAKRITAIFDEKMEAISRAKEIAQNYGTSVNVERQDGTFKNIIDFAKD